MAAEIAHSRNSPHQSSVNGDACHNIRFVRQVKWLKFLFDVPLQIYDKVYRAWWGEIPNLVFRPTSSVKDRFALIRITNDDGMDAARFEKLTSKRIESSDFP